MWKDQKGKGVVIFINSVAFEWGWQRLMALRNISRERLTCFHHEYSEKCELWKTTKVFFFITFEIMKKNNHCNIIHETPPHEGDMVFEL